VLPKGFKKHYPTYPTKSTILHNILHIALEQGEVQRVLLSSEW